MTWFKVDDSFHSHPKALASSPAALGLWVVAGSWSGANLSDGFIPDHVLPRLLPDAGTLAKELSAAGLWKRVRGGYRFHDWGHFNPQREVIEEERKAARERMQKLRSTRRAADRPQNRSPEQPANVRPTFATPTRPDPILGGALGDPLTPHVRDTPPPSKCPDHEHLDDPPPCGRCADARRALERWETDHAAAAAEDRSRAAREHAEAARLAIAACDQCDPDGRLPGNLLCHHDPANPDRARRGAAAAAAAIRRPKDAP